MEYKEYQDNSRTEKKYDFPTIEEHKLAKNSLKKKVGLNRILGKSRSIQLLHNSISQIATCDVSLIITGESGVGKELVARAVHYASERSGKPFIPVNCGAIPDNLFENELFGHVKGAFTDASLIQNGLVKEAEGGTLFLDEVGTLSSYNQVKLLRLLQEREYRPLGESKSRKADLRIIAATNEDLLYSTNKGRFREDLFYRLNIVSIHIPPLREREGDIAILIDHFINIYTRQYKLSPKKITEEAISLLSSYPWPGNIRELENKIQQLVVMVPSNIIGANDLNLPLFEAVNEGNGHKIFSEAKKEVVDLFEKQYLAKLLADYGGNVANSARRAGKSRTSMWNLLKKHNISPKEFSV